MARWAAVNPQRFAFGITAATFCGIVVFLVFVMHLVLLFRVYAPNTRGRFLDWMLFGSRLFAFGTLLVAILGHLIQAQGTLFNQNYWGAYFDVMAMALIIIAFATSIMIAIRDTLNGEDDDAYKRWIGFYSDFVFGTYGALGITIIGLGIVASAISIATGKDNPSATAIVNFVSVGATIVGILVTSGGIGNLIVESIRDDADNPQILLTAAVVNLLNLIATIAILVLTVIQFSGNEALRKDATVSGLSIMAYTAGLGIIVTSIFVSMAKRENNSQAANLESSQSKRLVSSDSRWHYRRVDKISVQSYGSRQFQ